LYLNRHSASINLFDLLDKVLEEAMEKIIFTLCLILISTFLNAGPPILLDRQTGKYLGNLSNNPYDPDSVSNPYGRYGSRYSPDSINNPYSKYGSRYSNDSVNNPYATNPPVIIDSDGYGFGY
jgi:hypothetical protein